MQRDRPGERARLVDQQLQVVVELRRRRRTGRPGGRGARPACRRGDRDLPGADLDEHAQPDQADRHRVAVLANGHHRLRIDPRTRLLAGLRPLVGQRSQQRPLACERLADRARVPGDPAREVGLAAGEQPGVQLGKAPDGRDGDEVAATEPADLALDAALLMRAPQGRPA